MIKLFTAVERLHKKGINHCDITPANILFCNGDLHLLDFGLATRHNKPLNPHAGTCAFRPLDNLIGNQLVGARMSSFHTRFLRENRDI